MTRQTLIAILAWATLAAGCTLFNLGLGSLINICSRLLCPDMPEATLWKLLATATSLASPIWVLLIMQWFKQRLPAQHA